MRQDPRLLVLTATTAIAYFVVGWLALGLALPPGYAAPLYPPAGLALAVAVVHGRRALPGIALGSFAVNWLLPSGQHAPLGTVAWLAASPGSAPPFRPASARSSSGASSGSP
jgi:integral membrane sensor domain MASE1